MHLRVSLPFASNLSKFRLRCPASASRPCRRSWWTWSTPPLLLTSTALLRSRSTRPTSSVCTSVRSETIIGYSCSPTASIPEHSGPSAPASDTSEISLTAVSHSGTDPGREREETPRFFLRNNHLESRCSAKVVLLRITTVHITQLVLIESLPRFVRKKVKFTRIPNIFQDLAGRSVPPRPCPTELASSLAPPSPANSPPTISSLAADERNLDCPQRRATWKCLNVLCCDILMLRDVATNPNILDSDAVTVSASFLFQWSENLMAIPAFYFFHHEFFCKYSFSLCIVALGISLSWRPFFFELLSADKSYREKRRKFKLILNSFALWFRIIASNQAVNQQRFYQFWTYYWLTDARASC